MAHQDERSTAEAVSLERATPDAAPLLSNLLELYIHDMSESFAVEIGSDGRFGYARLPQYWSEPDRRYAFLIKRGARVAGFALVTRGSPATDDPDDLDVAEFFVLRRYRRSGVGKEAAFALWSGLPGRWVVRVVDANRGALPFWRAAVSEYTSGSFSERTRPGSPHNWHVFTFDSPAPSSRI
jgi:predicted acetyltransferase